MLKVHSIFESISGEVGTFPQGTWCTFVRLQGCNLRCVWCDTVETQDMKKMATEMTPAEIAGKIQTRSVVLTGGEPLAQREVVDLLFTLSRFDHQVQVETNGSIPPPDDPIAHFTGWVVDYKCPSSMMFRNMPKPEIFARWWVPYDAVIKFVVDPSNEDDLSVMMDAMSRMNETALLYRKELRFAISPMDAKGECIPEIVKRLNRCSQLQRNVSFSVQLHKLINLP
jgi:7-carboxy-7-deazaguanine synthase